jgi:hypothetical protein
MLMQQVTFLQTPKLFLDGSQKNNIPQWSLVSLEQKPPHLVKEVLEAITHSDLELPH